MKRIALSFFAICLAIILACCSNEIAVDESYSTPTVVGRISLPEDSGLSPSDIYIQVAESGMQYTAALDGSFAIGGLEEGVEYTLYFSSVPFSNAVARDLPGNGNDNNGNGNPGNNGHGNAYGAKKDKVKGEKGDGCDIGIVNVKKTGSIVGTASLKDSSDFIGIDVFIPGTSFMAKTDSEGGYAISNVPEGIYDIAFMREGYTTIYKSGVMLVINEDEENNQVTLDPVTLASSTTSITGALVFEGWKGSAMPSAAITATSTADPSINSTTTSDVNGQFHVPGLKDGIYSLSISPTDSRFQRLVLESVEVKAPALSDVGTLVIKSFGGTITGHVSLSGGESGENVTILAESESYRYSTVTNSDGDFTIQSVIPDSYTLSIMKTGYQSARCTCVVTSTETVRIEERLNAAYGFITGRVFLAGDEDYSGVTVKAECANLAESVPYSAVTAVDGSFSIRVERSAQYTVTASASGYISSEALMVDITIGNLSDVGNISLKRNQGAVRGTALAEGASSHEGINLRLASDNLVYTTTTDQQGNFVFSAVSPGTYSLLASRDGYISRSVENIAVLPESTTEIEEGISLRVGVRNLSGTVRLEMADDHAGVTITASSIEDPTRIYSALSNSEGAFSLAGMLPGVYRISLAYRGYRTVTLPTLDITGETVRTIEPVELEIDRGLVSGIVKLGGRSDYSGTLVELVGTDYSTTTDKAGFWQISVPSANYPGGVVYSHEDFEPTADSNTITVLTNGTYGVAEATLEAIAITVKGRIEVAATDDASSVSVWLENTNFSMRTDASGTFSFEHVPLGEYRLIVERDNTPRAEVKFTAVPCEVLDLETIRIIPKSSNISGRVYLDGMDYHENIQVRVTTDGEDLVYTTTTDSTGYYYIGNLISEGTHRVVFSKDGWDTSRELVVTGLKPLETRTLDTVTLYDTTAPLLKSVRINNGVNTAVNKAVTITIDAEDGGSGLAWINIYSIESGEEIPNLDNVDDTPYQNQLTGYTLKSGNGERTVYVRVVDKSGNRSEVAKATVTLVDQKTEVSGALVGEDILWTVAKSPYLVTGSVLVRKDQTLTIEPGVDVQFAGDFSIMVEGTLKAIGTEDKRISFYGVENGEGTWMGINGGNDNLSYTGSMYDPQYGSGSILSNVDISGASKGVHGNIFVEHSSIRATTALSNFSGIINRSDVTGNISTTSKLITNNTITAGNFENGYIIDTKRLMAGNIITTENLRMDSSYIEEVVVNNYIKVDEMQIGDSYSLCTLSNNSVEGCVLRLFGGYGSDFQLVNNDFDQIEVIVNINSGYRVAANFNNLQQSTSETDRSEWAELDFKYNFWGKTNTLELEDVGNLANTTFINDYFDTNFEKSRVVYDNWLKSENTTAGYKGDKYVAFDAEWDGQPFAKIGSDYSMTVTGTLTVNIESLDGKTIAAYRYSTDPNAIFEKGWISASASVNIPISADEAWDVLTNEAVFIQLKDSDGNISGVCTVEVLKSAFNGPAGGYIIYDNDKTTSDGWRFIEVSPDRLSVVYHDDGSRSYSFGGDNYDYSSFGYYRLSPNGTNLLVNGKTTSDDTCTSAEIGAGKTNTEKLVNNRKGNLYYSETGDKPLEISLADAIYMAEYNGYDDWYLPSSKEAMLFVTECRYILSSRSNMQYVPTSTEENELSSEMVYAFYDPIPNMYYSDSPKVSGQTVYGVRYF